MHQDTDLADEAIRISLTTALMRHTITRLGAAALPARTDPAALTGLARRLVDGAEGVGARVGVSFIPAYPGRTGGAEVLGDACRIVVACTASDRAGRDVGVVFTTLISGRPPSVSVAPPGSQVPGDWRPLQITS